MTENSNNNASWLRSPTAILLIILAAGLFMRIWAIWFGLPFLFHNDEGFEVVRALQLGAGQFDFTRVGKGGYFYLLFFEYGLLFAVLLMTGVISSANEFAELYLKDPTGFYLIGRTTTAIIGTVTIYLVFMIGRRAYSTGAGIIAAAFLAMNVLHACLSHFITVDVPMTCLAVASLYFSIRIAQGGTDRDYWLAALFAALATTTKMPAALLILPLLVSHYYAIAHNQGGLSDFFRNRQLWQAAAIFVVTYVVLTPGIVLYGPDIVVHVLAKFGIGRSEMQVVEAELELLLDDRAMFANTNLFVFYIDVLVDSMTWPVFLMCMAGLVYAVWCRTPADVVLVSFAVPMYLMVSLTADIHQFFPRYMLPAIPVLVLFGARLLEAILRLFAGARYGLATTAVVVLCAIWPMAQIAAFNSSLLQEDTRAIARQWVDENIPEGSRIFIEGHRTTLSNATIPLQNSAANIRESIEYYRGQAPGRVKYFNILLKVQEGKTYDLVGVSPFRLDELQHYKDMGVQYFVLRPEVYPGSRTQFHWEDFVEDIRADPDIELIKRFEPERPSAPGPVIEIYRVVSNIEVTALVGDE